MQAIGSPPRPPSLIERARRQQIVEAALVVIARQGVADASFAKIAAEAGLSSTGLISYHFSDRTDLLRAVAAEAMRIIEAHIKPRLEEVSGGAARLRAYIEANLGLLDAHPSAMQALLAIAAHAGGDSSAQAEISGAINATLDFQIAWLRDGQAAGEFGAFDPTVMMLAIRGALDAVIVRAVRTPGFDVPRAASDLADLFDRATRPGRPRKAQT